MEAVRSGQQLAKNKHVKVFLLFPYLETMCNTYLQYKYEAIYERVNSAIFKS